MFDAVASDLRFSVIDPINTSIIRNVGLFGKTMPVSDDFHGGSMFL